MGRIWESVLALPCFFFDLLFIGINGYANAVKLSVLGNPSTEHAINVFNEIDKTESSQPGEEQDEKTGFGKKK